jgi:hypothetical protein
VSPTLVLFVVRATDNSLWSVTYDPTTLMYGPRFAAIFNPPIAAGQVASSPAAAIDANGVIWVAALGFDGQLKVFLKQPGEAAFRTPFTVEAGPFVGDPAIGVGFGPETNITVFGIGVGDHACYALDFDIATHNLTAGPTRMGGRHLAITTAHPRIVVGIGTDSRLYYTQLAAAWPGDPWLLVDNAPVDIIWDGIASANLGDASPFLFGTTFGGALVSTWDWPWGH